MWGRADSSVEDMNLAGTPLDQLPDMKAATQRSAAAVAEFAAAEAALKRVNALISPYSNKDNSVDVLEYTNAKLQFHEAERRYLVGEVAKLQAERNLQRVRDEAQRLVFEARIPARKPLMRQLFDAVENAVVVAEQLAAYDAETYRLCGQTPETPFPQLLRTWSGGENQLEFQRRHFSELLE